jgi:hypothetical protein
LVPEPSAGEQFSIQIRRVLPITGDSAEQVKVLLRSHQSLIRARQRQVHVLRSNLREYYSAALVASGVDLDARDAPGPRPGPGPG